MFENYRIIMDLTVFGILDKCYDLIYINLETVP